MTSRLANGDWTSIGGSTSVDANGTSVNSLRVQATAGVRSVGRVEAHCSVVLEGIRSP